MNAIYELGELFEQVQMNAILGDGKIFPDCSPKTLLSEIETDYIQKKKEPSFDLKKFVLENFILPQPLTLSHQLDKTISIEQHISSLWSELTRQPSQQSGSFIPLPQPYVVPGGRFREIYYWDSYFTMLGLRESGRTDLIQHMVNNFAYLIDTVGYIPNGNRTYFLGRSQPPFFSLMVKLLHEVKGDSADDEEPDSLATYLPQLEKEYLFWMRGSDEIKMGEAKHHVVKMDNGTVLNRYWDENNTPRPEAYKEDVELSLRSKQKPETLFRHIRAAAESGWDFSSRWFKDNSFASIYTTDLVPVDLNCLLFYLEKTLAEIYLHTGNREKSNQLVAYANQRKAAIKKYCWNDEKKFFFDYDFVERKQKQSFTLAAAFPLFFEIASPEQAVSVHEILKNNFLKPGGMITTLQDSGQQWDAPNGWAPLQWICFKSLLNYGFEETAFTLKQNWLTLNQTVYLKSGKLTEKYNVCNQSEAGGGEYPNQDGFGWTNGVFLAMTNFK
ncbi:MAG: alpha,alpha-trehalase TreF [Bacteroidetes bacterium]|nr:alpha,alpha-trehalase TreF [Bacteroidota bacterium]